MMTNELFNNIYNNIDVDYHTKTLNKDSYQNFKRNFILWLDFYLNAPYNGTFNAYNNLCRIAYAANSHIDDETFLQYTFRLCGEYAGDKLKNLKSLLEHFRKGYQTMRSSLREKIWLSQL